jgi:hypothetical protein
VVHVPVLENKTAEPASRTSSPGPDQAVVQSARVRIARNAQEADATLSGSIVEYRLAAISFDRSANVLLPPHHRTGSDPQGSQAGQDLWKQDRIEERADFLVAGQVTQTLARESRACRGRPSTWPAPSSAFAFEGF